MPAISATRLTRRFGPELAVDAVDLTVEEGEIYGFLGPNGAGKSTTVRMLVTLLAPSEGDAIVAGASVSRDPDTVRLRIGAALQATALDKNQTGREILVLQGRLYGLSRADVRRRVEELAELVDIGPALDARISTYSGGMRRRLDLAAALVHAPRVLFLDEPTTGLDPVSRARMWDEVRRLNRDEGVTVFLTTQYLEEADRLADRIGIIDRGRIVAEGTPSALKRSVGTDLVLAAVADPGDELVELLRRIPGVDRVDRHLDGLTTAAQDGSLIVGPVAVALHEAGATVGELTLRTASLDDVFLEVTGSRFAAAEAGGAA
ncbi:MULTISPECIES: ATP-binding cassette domain-containing protein [Microbacterium]|uniref:ATP-binding cassette domain-containing protein n=1 Tax=Microbacterium TaxID=33882 RepID=UPI001B7D0F40|nr:MULTISPECIES: ATP-binding cassette domain-containing protein [Microbacterium]